VRDELDARRREKTAEEISHGYEAPELVALGNLHDLLAGDQGTQCDLGALDHTGQDGAIGVSCP
jgi:hypothetical protein